MLPASPQVNIKEIITEIKSRISQELLMARGSSRSKYEFALKKLKKEITYLTYPTASASTHLQQIKRCIEEWREQSEEVCVNFSIKNINCQYKLYNPDTRPDKGKEFLQYLDHIIETEIDPILEDSLPSSGPSTSSS